MTREEILNTPEIVDFMLDKSVMVDSKIKLHKRLKELCKLAIKALEQEPCEYAISRDDALKLIRDCGRCDDKSAYGTIYHGIEHLPPVQPKIKTGHWIPCSERLPKKEKKTYWVCTDTEYQCECRWTNNRFGLGEGEWGWSIFDTPQYSKPIAWMPLPKPYREVEE